MPEKVRQVDMIWEPVTEHSHDDAMHVYASEHY
jgi:hypothetical protein